MNNINNNSVEVNTNHTGDNPVIDSLSTILTTVLEYASNEIPVFPCKPDKTPYTSHGFKDATTDQAQIKKWWSQHPDAMIGMPTGNVSGVFVIDIDVNDKENGFETLTALEAQYGPLPVTLTSMTPSGGTHQLFSMPETGSPLRNSTRRLGPGLDTRGEGGYIILSPSVNSNGKSYQFVDRDIHLAELPEWVIDKLIESPKKTWQTISTIDITDGTPYGLKALEEITKEMASTPKGQRNDTLYKLSCRLGSLVAGDELSESSAEQLKQAAIQAGLEAEEIEKTFNSGFSTGMESPSSAPVNDCSCVANVACSSVAKFEKYTDWPEPQPITQKIEYKEYPVDVLPATIKFAVKEVQSFVKAPVAMVTASALGALSLAIQAHFDVERASKLKSPIGLFLLTIADSGERKSTCDSFFMKVIHEYEASERKKAIKLLRDYELRHKDWDEQYKIIAEKIKLNRKENISTSDLEGSLLEIEQNEPEKPKIPKLSYADATPEALASGLAKQWPSGGLISAEAGTVFGSPGMSKESVMKSLSLLNQLWDGGVIQIDRKTSESFIVSGVRLTTALQVQQATLRTFINNAGGLARGSGFLARFLITRPDSTQGTRFFEEPPYEWPELTKFNVKIATFLEKRPNICKNGALSLQCIGFEPKAKEIWISFHDSVEKKLVSDGKFAEIRDVASKAADNAARLAALFHIFEHSSNSICSDCMSRAIDIMFWYLDESLRFFSETALNEEQIRISKLDFWLINHCITRNTNNISFRYTQQRSPVRKPEHFLTALYELYRLNRLQIIDGKQKIIELNPLLL